VDTFRSTVKMGGGGKKFEKDFSFSLHLCAMPERIDMHRTIYPSPTAKDRHNPQIMAMPFLQNHNVTCGYAILDV